MADSVTITAGFHDGTDGNDNLLTSVSEYSSVEQRFRTTLYSSGARGFGGDDTISNNGYLENILFDGGAGNDSIVNGEYNHHVNNVTLLGGAGDDRIETYGDNAIINAGDGDNAIRNYGDNATISGGAGNDSISNYGDGAIITAGDGDDTITSSGNDVTIDAGAGDDTVWSNGANITVHGGQGNDSLSGNGVSSLDSKIFLDDTIGNNYFHISQSTNATIQAGAGDDIINSDGYNENLLINAGDGANSITSHYNSNITINAAEGNDTINFYDSNGILIQAGDGANYIYSYNYNLADMADFTILSGAGKDTVSTYGLRTLIVSGAGNDSITHVGANSTIQGGDGDDYINNHDGSRDYSTNPTIGANNLVEGGAGNDSIYNACNNVTVNGGTGDDYISSGAVDGALLLGGDGNDSLYNTGNINREFPTNTTLNGGNGDDFIDNLGNNVTINGGSGNDTISLRTGRGPGKTYSGSENVLINYTFGDGNDLIEGFNETSTLSISGGGYTSIKSGSDVVLGVDNSSITLSGAANLETLNIIGTLEGSGVNVTNEDDDKTITGTEYADTINNSGQRVLITSYASRDIITNSGASTAILSGAGNDVINNGAANVIINSGDGNDVIGNIGANNSIVSGAGNDSVDNQYGDNSTITTGDGDDTINNYNSEDVLIEAGAGADFIYSHGSVTGSTIDAGESDDTINNSGDGVYIVAGEGADSVNNSGANVSISLGSGDDSIIDNTGASVAVDMGAGNDYIFSTGANSSITGGEGADYIYNGGSKDRGNHLGSYTLRGGDNVTMTGGADNDIITNYKGDYAVIDGGKGDDQIYNSYGNHLTITDLEGNNYISSGGGVDMGGGHSSAITTGDGNDTIRIANYANDVTVNSGGGNDWVVGQWNERMLVQTGAGNDTIGTNSCTSSTLDAGAGDDLISVIDVNSYVVAGAGNDSIYFQGDHTTIEAGDGDDTITHGTNNGYNMYLDGGKGNDLINGTAEGTLIGGAGNDTITTNGWNNIINGGAGNDLITLRSSNDTIVYEAGDGNDTILGFGEFVTDIGAHALSISGGTYASQISGDDITISVGKGSILLRGVATLDNLNIIGEEEEGPTWHLDDGNATYGTSDKTEVTLTGIGSLDGVKLDGKTVTLSAAALNGKTVTITKGYTLKIDKSVPTSTTKTEAGWNGDTYTAAGTSAYYKLSSNKLTFTPAKGGEQFTLTGIADTKGVKVSGTKVTVGKAALGDSDITLTTKDGFTLAFDKSVTAAKEIKSGWTSKKGVYTYTAAGTTEGYKLGGNTISYSEPEGGETFTISGVKDIKNIFVDGKTVTVGKNSLNGKTIKLTGEDFALALANDVPTKATEVEGGFTSVTKGTAIFKTSGYSNDFYTLGDNEITYTAKGGNDIKISNLDKTATEEEVADAIEITGDESDLKITFNDAAVLTTKAPTISAPKGVYYTVAVNEKLSVAEQKSDWTTKGTNATLAVDTSATYTVKNNKVTCTPKKSGKPEVVLAGLVKDAKLATPKDKLITLDADNLGTKTSLKSNAGGYSIELTGDMSGKIFVGSAAADTIQIAANNALVDGGKGNDEFNISGANVTILSSAGNDTASFADGFADGFAVSLSGTTTVKELAQTDSGVQLTFSNKATLTVADVTDNTFDVVDKNQNFTVDTAKFALAKSLTFDKPTSPTSVTVADDFTGSLLQADDLYLGGGKLSNVATFDASNVTGNIFIEGNAKANTLRGGLSSTTLEGGKGNDLFVFNGDELTIADYGNGSDKIDLGEFSIAGVTLPDSDDKSRDLVLTLSDGENYGTLNIIGGGKDAKGKDVKISFNGDKNAYIFETDKIYNSGRTAVTLLGADGDLSGEPKVKAITAAESFTGEEIIGNTAANTIEGNSAANSIDGGAGNDKIFGNGGDDTLWGGAGNDTLIGGDDSDTFIYNNGEGKDVVLGFADNDLLQIPDDFTTSVNNTGTEIAFTIGKGSLTLKDFTATDFNINGTTYQIDNLPNRK